MAGLQKQVYTGVAFAMLATLVWSGNFIVARKVINDVPPVALAFFRWLCATAILIPFVWKRFGKDRSIVFKHLNYFFWTALFGVAIFNTFLYVAAHTTSAINMALIGTCSSPVFSIILAAIVLNEKITALRVAGMIMCLSGVTLLLVKGSWERLMHFQFTSGDIWVLGAAIFFAGYNIMVRMKPAGISPYTFLLVTFCLGTLQLLPFYIVESSNAKPIEWTFDLVMIVLYLGLGTSVLAFLLWNFAIAKLGAARTALFGNLIPLFSSIEAVIILKEALTAVHILAGLVIIAGVIIANMNKRR